MTRHGGISKVTTLNSRRRLLAVVGGAAMATGVVLAGPAAYAAPLIQPRSVVLASAAQAFAAASPTDAQLAGRTDEDIVDVAVRCTTLDGSVYCLHLGWRDQAPDRTELRASVTTQAAQTAKVAATGSVDAGQGDMPLATQIRRWAAAPRAERVAAEQAEMKEALAALGKVRLMSLTEAGRPVPDSFWTAYPETAAWGKPLVAARAGTAARLAADTSTVGSTARAQKQINGYYCGPTSMVAFGWNDPVVGNRAGMNSQSHWASRLGTTTQGSAITTIASRINTDLTWDNTAGKYVVVNIGDKTDGWWQEKFIDHIAYLRAPIQLHPDYEPDNNTWGRDTGGHFNVGRGYYYNGATKTIYLYEPAFGSAVPAATSQPLAMVIKANRAHPMKNIAY
jgi:hypothetical protein